LTRTTGGIPSIYKVGIYDAKGTLQGTTMAGTLVISSVSNSGYTKISNSGAELPDTAKLGSGANDWACTKDNKTDLTWEVKTLKSGLRNMDNVYTNYFLDEIGYGTSNNTDVFVSAVNQKTLCGKSDWRLPVLSEIKTLVFCSDGKYEANGSCTNWKEVTKPTINTVFFLIQKTIGIGLRRPLLAIVAVRGMSTSTTAILAATIRTTMVLFGWCVSDSFFLLLGYPDGLIIGENQQ